MSGFTGATGGLTALQEGFMSLDVHCECGASARGARGPQRTSVFNDVGSGMYTGCGSPGRFHGARGTSLMIDPADLLVWGLRTDTGGCQKSAQVIQTRYADRSRSGHRLPRAAFMVIGKCAEVVGKVQFALGRPEDEPAQLIEYK